MSNTQQISIAVDIVLFAIVHGKLSVLLVNRKYKPYQWLRALPGGFVEHNESLEEAAKRQLAEETSIKDVFLRELQSFSQVHRDPRGRVVSILYIWIIMEDIYRAAGSDAQLIDFFPVNKLPPLAFDHKEMIIYARKYLAVHLRSSALTKHFLPTQFTLSELQAVYEAISLRTWEVRNFRKKIVSWWILKETKKYEQSVWHRPARLYEFKHKSNYLLP